MHRLLAMTLLLVSLALAQQTPTTTGMIRTPEADLAYESYGAPGPAIPVIVANGGPGLSHVYMLQNNVWTRLSNHRQIVFFDQRGTGKSKNVKPDASWGMDSQVSDLEAVRAKFGFQKFDLVGDSYGGLLAMAYAAAHPSTSKSSSSETPQPQPGKTSCAFYPTSSLTCSNRSPPAKKAAAVVPMRPTSASAITSSCSSTVKRIAMPTWLASRI